MNFFGPWLSTFHSVYSIITFFITYRLYVLSNLVGKNPYMAIFNDFNRLHKKFKKAQIDSRNENYIKRISSFLHGM